MGKSKKRILAKGINRQLSTISRSEAIEIVVKSLSDKEIPDIISLFGLRAEELLEAGMSYEQVMKLEGLL